MGKEVFISDKKSFSEEFTSSSQIYFPLLKTLIKASLISSIMSDIMRIKAKCLDLHMIRLSSRDKN